MNMFKRFDVTCEAVPLLAAVMQVRTFGEPGNPVIWTDALTLTPTAAGLEVALGSDVDGRLALVVPFVQTRGGLSAAPAVIAADRFSKARPRTITVSGGELEEVLTSSAEDPRRARVTIAEGHQHATVTLGAEVREITQCALDLIVAPDRLPLVARLWRGDLAVALEHLRRAEAVAVEVRVGDGVVGLIGSGGGVVTTAQVEAFTPPSGQLSGFARLTLGQLEAIVDGATGPQLEIGWDERGGGRWSVRGEGMAAELPAGTRSLWDGDLSLVSHLAEDAVGIDAAVLMDAVLRAVEGRDRLADGSPAHVVLEQLRGCLGLLADGAPVLDRRWLDATSRERGEERTVEAHALVNALAPLQGKRVFLRFDVPGALVLVEESLAQDPSAPRSVLPE